MLHRIARGLLPALLFVLSPLPAAEPLGPQLLPTPRARLMPSSATNRPFLAAARAQQPVDLRAAGYAESEYLVSGVASIYAWVGTPEQA